MGAAETLASLFQAENDRDWETYRTFLHEDVVWHLHAEHERVIHADVARDRGLCGCMPSTGGGPSHAIRTERLGTAGADARTVLVEEVGDGHHGGLQPDGGPHRRELGRERG